jgi:protein TonB
VIPVALLLFQANSVTPPAMMDLAPAKAIAAHSRVLSGYPISADYPRGALARDAQGVSQVRLRIEVNGTARDCQVIRSSGDAELDFAACQITTTRTRFAPAIDVDGKPTVEYVILPIRWAIGG